MVVLQDQQFALALLHLQAAFALLLLHHLQETMAIMHALTKMGMEILLIVENKVVK
jgi:hypothetical protein